jgi:nucleoside-diphosphate-sugar epimerase
VTRGLPFVLADDVAAAMTLALGRSGLEGRAFNLVGDVRLSARQYIDELSRETCRDVRLHRRSVLAWAAAELGIWSVKAIGRKPNNVRMTYRELAYRTATSEFDCRLAKEQLGWRPVADREEFVEKAVRRALRGTE